MKKILIFVLVLAALVGFRMYGRAGAEKDVLGDIQMVVGKMGFSAEDTAYLDGVLERVHPAAFDAAYDLGGRRRAAELDSEIYITEVFNATIKACDADGKEHLVEDLEQLRDGLLEGARS